MNIKKEYLDFVVVQEAKLGFKLLCEAPWLSHIKDGEDVIVEDIPDGVVEGTVVASLSGRRESDVTDFLKKVFGVNDFRKIICRFERIEMEYEEETENVMQEVD